MSIVNRPSFVSPPPTEDPEGFVRRSPSSSRYQAAGIERRQFPNSGIQLSDEAAELARAIDIFKRERGIQRINTEQMLSVMHSLNYSKHG